MLFVVLASLSVVGSTVFAVLNHPLARDKARHDRTSVILLTVSSAALVASAAWATADRLSAAAP